MPVARGGMNQLAVTVRDLRRSEDLFYAPVASDLGYDKVEDMGAMTVWYAPEARAPSTSGRRSPRAGGASTTATHRASTISPSRPKAARTWTVCTRFSSTSASRSPILRPSIRITCPTTMPCSSPIRTGSSSSSSTLPCPPETRPPEASHAHQHPDARPLSHHGEGQPCQVAEEGGRRGQVRRRHRRDRDGQGDHGGRGDR